MPSPPRGETQDAREIRRGKMAPIDALAEGLQHDAGSERRQSSCTHTPSETPICCWCGAHIEAADA